jgi:phage shock protein A
MTDSITRRVSRVISAGAHALLDKAEDLAPERVLMEAIQEIDQVIDEIQLEAGRGEAMKHLVEKQIERLDGERTMLAQQAGVAVKTGRDDLAEVAVGRMTEIEDEQHTLLADLERHETSIGQQERLIQAVRVKRRELELALRSYLTARASSDGIAGTPVATRQRLLKVDAATGAFGRVLARQIGSGTLSLDVRDAALLSELAELQRRERVSERLGAIKAALTTR